MFVDGGFSDFHCVGCFVFGLLLGFMIWFVLNLFVCLFDCVCFGIWVGFLQLLEFGALRIDLLVFCIVILSLVVFCLDLVVCGCFSLWLLGLKYLLILCLLCWWCWYLI